MIIEEAELRVLLGLASSITDEERAVLQLIHPGAEGRVKQHLGYDPEQRSAAEYYPRFEGDRGGEFAWDVNEAHTHARQYSLSSVNRETLQLLRIPVRSISDLRVDSDGRFGKGTSAFGSGTDWTEGEDFWPEYEEDNYCPSGLLRASGSWPDTPGSIKVTYRGGYAPLELDGLAATSGTDSDGNLYRAGVDASGIKRAVALTVIKAMNTWAQNKKKAQAGWTGPMASEKLGDYSYTLAKGGMDTSMAVALPAEAADELEPFLHYGLLRT